MNDLIEEAMFEFALTLQLLIDRGWRVKEIDYGERRFGIGPKLLLECDGVIKEFYSVNDIEAFLSTLRGVPVSAQIT